MPTLNALLKTQEGKAAATEVDRRIKAAVKPIQAQLDAAVGEIGNLRQEIEALKRKR